jgi:O-antigen ligase
MKFLEFLGKGLDGLIGVVLLVLLLVPPLHLQVTVLETYKVPQEFLIVTIGWVFIGLVALARSLAGQPLWSGGSKSWARWGTIGFCAWLWISSALGYSSALPWQFAMTVTTYLMIGQSILDWTEARLGRRNLVLAGLTLLVGCQVALSLAEYFRVPFSTWAKTVPTFTQSTGSIPYGWWLHDICYVLGFPSDQGALVGTLGNVNYLAEFLALLLPVLVTWAISLKSKLGKVALGLVLVPAFLVLVATGTRAALLGLMLSGLLAAGLVWGWSKVDLRRWWADSKGKGGILASAIVLVALSAVTGGTLLQKLSRGVDGNIQGRLMIWKNALDLWAAHPFSGAGLGGFRVLNVAELERHFSTGLPSILALVRFGQVHNDPLQALVELGVVGFSLLLVVAVAWWREVCKNESLTPVQRFGHLWAMGALLVASCFGFPFHIPVTALAVVVVFALGLASEREATASVPVIWRPAYALVACGLIAVMGVQAVQKDVWPLFQAHRYGFVAGQLKDQSRYKEAEVVYDLAFRHNRFKGAEAYYVLSTLVDQQKYDEVLKRYDEMAKVGIGTEGNYWKARALYATGKTVDAVNTYNYIIRYFGEQDDNAKRSKRRLAEIAEDLLKQKDKNGLKLVVKKQLEPAKPQP